MFNKVINRLPDNYNKNKNSINGKLYQIFIEELQEIKDVLAIIKMSRDMDNAIGSTLDRIGNNVFELRDTEDDDLYRTFIKTKIISNLSKGDIETINQVANVLLGKNFRSVTETWNQSKYNNEVAGLAITMRNQANLLPFRAIDRTIAGGVGLKWVLEYKQNTSEIYISMATISGEEITVYPYSPKNIESKGNIYIGVGSNTVVENMTVYPRKEVI